MKKTLVNFGILLAVIASLFGLHYSFEAGRTYFNTKKMEKAVNELEDAVVTLSNNFTLEQKIENVMQFQPEVTQSRKGRVLLAQAIEGVIKNFLTDKDRWGLEFFIENTLRKYPNITGTPELRTALAQATEAHLNIILSEDETSGVEGAIKMLQIEKPDYAKLPEIISVFAKARKAVALKEEERLRAAIVVWHDSWSKKLPHDLNGSNIKELYNEVRKIVSNAPEKDDYMTNEEHKRVLAEYFTNSSVGFAKMSDQLVLTYPNLSKESYAFGYDAEYQQFYFDPSRYPLMVSEQTSKTRYQAENAFGVQREVTRERWNTWQIIDSRDLSGKQQAGIFPTSMTDYYGKEKKVEMIYRVAPKAARQLKDKVGAIFIFSLAPPYAGTDSKDYEPTINSPEDIHYSQHLLFGHRDKVIMYRTDTKEILAIRDY